MITVLKDTLEKRGALGQIKARIRAEVFNALDDQSEPRPPLSHENLLINELIREYLEFNKYKYAASVLTAAFVISVLSRPLLYGIISHFLHRGKEESIQSPLPKVSLLNYPKQNFDKPSTERNQKELIDEDDFLIIPASLALQMCESIYVCISFLDRIPEPGRMAGTSIEEPLVLQSIKR
ncbi:hypothetical protein ASZ78_002279 [Callipepla squamata]|uniref:FGFR1 oncogene partner (FOP) N-terminal dimerisation domain-containing protein n=1 Tax=Callipepla squamata TaxID=9009 RepID=A0A226NMY8_CALSU|nr:hypothetical protein ASZ78_002279 [Callipepla squamata]